MKKIKKTKKVKSKSGANKIKQLATKASGGIKGLIRKIGVYLDERDKRLDESAKGKGYITRIKGFQGIKVKLIAAFLAPALLFIFVGIMIYSKSRAGLTENTERLTSTSVETLKEYFQLGFENIELSATRITVNDDLIEYYTGSADVNSDLYRRQRIAVKATISSESTADRYIRNVVTFAKSGQACSQEGLLDADVYEAFASSDEVATVDYNGSAWISNHSSIDELINTSSDEYAMTYVKVLNDSRNRPNGYVLIDVKTDFIQEILDDASVGKESIKVFVTGDGKQVVSGSDDFDITKCSFYDGVMDSEESGYKYVTYDHEKYLFVYAKIEEGNGMLSALVPREEIIEDANDIGGFIIVTVILCFVIAVVLGSVFASGISKAIKKVNVVMKQTAEGDLTGSIVMRRKDEFSILSGNIMNMIVSVKSIILKMAHVSGEVQDSANKVGNISEVLLKATQDITSSVGDIEAGIIQQSNDTESCLAEMSSLAEKIGDVHDSTGEISKVASDAQVSIDNGMVIINELNERVIDTTNITEVVIENINDLHRETEAVAGILSTINDIAKQTNLLSLNASIEASRAGEAGRGFAVVSDEIRNLAEQSAAAGKKINGIITNIQKRMTETIETASKAQGVVKYQQEALDETIDVFKSVKEQVANLVLNLDVISKSIDGIENAKNDTLEAIASISATSNETEASSVTLSRNAEEQLKAVEVLNQAVHSLVSDAEDLDETVKVFKITSEVIEDITEEAPEEETFEEVPEEETFEEETSEEAPEQESFEEELEEETFEEETPEE